MIFSHGLNIANQVLLSQAGLKNWVASASQHAGIDLAVACAITDQLEQQLALVGVRWSGLDTYVRHAEISLDKRRFEEAQKSLGKAGEVIAGANLWLSLAQVMQKMNGRYRSPNEKGTEVIMKKVTLHWMAEFVRTSDPLIVSTQARSVPKTPLERLIMLFGLEDASPEKQADIILTQATEVFSDVTDTLAQSDFEGLDAEFAAALAELKERNPEMVLSLGERAKWAMALYKDLVVRHKYPLSKLVCFIWQQDPDFSRELRAMIAGLLKPNMRHPFLWEIGDLSDLTSKLSSLLYIIQYDPAILPSELLGLYKKIMGRWGMPKHLREQWRDGV